MKKIRMMMAAALGVLVSCGSVKSGEEAHCGFPRIQRLWLRMSLRGVG